MIAKQTVFLTGDRSQAVPEGHKDARFLLVREGHDIEEALAEQHGALDLVNSVAAKAKPVEPAPSREHMPPPNPPPTATTTAPAATAAAPEKSAAKAPKAKKSAKSRK